ncbi:hypothetical protein [uncultured Olleya sp.]|nr:hypothetical protein [uncultured Olleya sp.]
MRKVNGIDVINNAGAIYFYLKRKGILAKITLDGMPISQARGA